MRKFVSFLLAVLMLCSSVAFADDYSGMSADELYAILVEVRAELLSRELQLTPGQIFMENDVVKMYLDKKDIEFTSSGYLKIPVILVSESPDEISFQIDSLMVNGWECFGSIGNIQTAGKKRTEITINCNDAEVTSIDEIEDIKVAFLAFNMGTFKRECETEPVTFVFENGELVKK